MSDLLALRNLTIAYGSTIVVENLSFAVGEGEFVALLGPSGCGKTTTMRAIAGLVEPRAGEISLAGRDITRIPANKRDVGLVFQSYALFPHLTVFENVAFGLRLKRLPRDEIQRRVRGAIESVGLSGLENRLPKALSGGQQQRVALARAAVVTPRVLLLDEPLSNLDARLRLEMRGELRRLQSAAGIAMLYVTHDQAEALALADRVVVMQAGKIEQIGSPRGIYERPRTDFVARFMGFENIFAVRGSALVDDKGGALPITGPLSANAEMLAWRPASVAIGAGPYRGRVQFASYQGATIEYLLVTPLGPIKAEVGAGVPRHAIGTDVAFDLPLTSAVPLIRSV
jgi:putative spermidine/putrescine transport system ATP-binding protein